MPHDEFDVVIIGAGAAGLGAAGALAGSGLSFLVVEARDRPGGRGWTTTLENGEPADLGCGWLHSAERNPFVAIAERQGLTIDKSPPPWSRVAAQLGANKPHMAAFGEAMERFRARVEEWPEDARDAACDTLLDPGEPLNPLIDAVSTYYSGAELAKVSIADLAAYEDSGVNWRVREGLGAAIAGLAVGAPIRHSCPVRAIDRRGETLAVETEQGVIRARAVIVTLPSDVIAQTPELFRPALPEKTEAASGLPLGLADKLFIELLAPQDFPIDARAFGSTARRATGAYAFRPLGRPLAEVFLGGELAASLERGGASAAWDFARQELIDQFGSGVTAKMRPLMFHGWRTDPWARGSYSYARPGCAGNRLTLAAPVEERLFFAGEACSPRSYSTAHGAYETGLRAASEAVQALGRPGSRS